MIDILTIQTFQVSPSLKVLQEANNSLKIANNTLLEKNDTLQKLIIVSLIIIPLLGFVLYRKQQQTKKPKQ
jgi:hypothetical protein